MADADSTAQQGNQVGSDRPRRTPGPVLVAGWLWGFYGVSGLLSLGSAEGAANLVSDLGTSLIMIALAVGLIGGKTWAYIPALILGTAVGIVVVAVLVVVRNIDDIGLVVIFVVLSLLPLLFMLMPSSRAWFKNR